MVIVALLMNKAAIGVVDVVSVASEAADEEEVIEVVEKAEAEVADDVFFDAFRDREEDREAG